MRVRPPSSSLFDWNVAANPFNSLDCLSLEWLNFNHDRLSTTCHFSDSQLIDCSVLDSIEVSRHRSVLNSTSSSKLTLLHISNLGFTFLLSFRTTLHIADGCLIWIKQKRHLFPMIGDFNVTQQPSSEPKTNLPLQMMECFVQQRKEYYFSKPNTKHYQSSLLSIFKVIVSSDCQ